MAANSEALQLIGRLTPLAEVLALIDAEVKPVTPRALDVAAAAGRTLAADASSPARPSAPIALADGWALSADLTLGAGGYSPAMLARMPSRVEAGQAMPPDTDSVAPFDAVKEADGRAEALITVNPGDGMLPAGGDCDPAIPLRRAGERLRITDLAGFAAAGIARVTVREPRVRVLPLRGTAIVAAAARLVAADIERRGGAVRLDAPGRGLDVALAAENADAIIAVGGTGSGAATPAYSCWRARAASRCTASRWRLAKPPRSALPARGRCCCCRDGSTRRSPSGWWSGGTCWSGLPPAGTTSPPII